MRAAMPTLPTHLLPVLVLYADSADMDGRHAGYRYTLTVLGARTGRSERQVRRDIRELETLGYLRPGRQEMAILQRADRRPTVYDLPKVEPWIARSAPLVR